MKYKGLNVGAKSLISALVIVCLIILVFPGVCLAQVGKEGLILTYASGGYRNDIKPGESLTVFIEVVNESDIATNNIQFSTDAPDGWLLEFNPQSIDVLGAGNFHTVEVTVTAPDNVEKGDYSITVIADSSVGRRVMGIYFWVEKGTNIWMWVGGALGVAVIIAFVFVYRRFARN